MVRITELDCKMGFPDAVSKIAEKMNWREYQKELNKDEEVLLEKNWIVVAFGYSDDNVEFRGAVNDEVGSYRGSETLFNAKGLIQNECDEGEYCPNFKMLLASLPHGTVTSKSDENGYTHKITANFRHEKFEILEGDDKYCIGIVFRLSETEIAD